jgi:putative transposase
LVDHLGLLITAVVGAANCPERDGLEALFFLRPKGQKLQGKVIVDQGYCGEDMRGRARKYGVEIEAVKRRETKGFIVELKRWIEERTFAWFDKFRRLSKDYELVTLTSLSMMYLVMTRLMCRKICQMV